MQTFQIHQQLRASISGGVPAIYLHSSEESRVDRLLLQLQQACALQRILEWNLGYGWVDFSSKQPVHALGGPAAQVTTLEQSLLELLETPLQHTLIVIKGARLALDGNPLAVARLKQLLNRIERDYSSLATVVLVGETVFIPSHIASQVTLLRLPLPDRQEIASLLPEALGELQLQVPDDLYEVLLDSLCGLGASEIRQALRMATQDDKVLSSRALQAIQHERELYVSRSGLLEIVRPEANPEQIGGLDNLKRWLEQRARIMRDMDAALRQGVQPPRGLLLAGMPGCGKSLTARVAASMFDLPLLRLNSSALQERSQPAPGALLQALETVETFGACVLWLDELEKAFPVAPPPEGRPLPDFIDWLQHRPGQVFVIATVNDVATLPADLLRRNCFDEVFYVGLPNGRERRAILEICLRKAGQPFDQLDLDELADQCRDYSGADIQNAIGEALTSAFLAGCPLNQLLASNAIRQIIPLRDSMSARFEQCEQLCERLKMRPASSQQNPSSRELRQLASDPNHLTRLKVACDPECPPGLLEQLANDPHLDIRRAVYRNPHCPQYLLSRRINIPHGHADYNSLLLGLACIHPRTPLDLVVNLLMSPGFHPERECLRLIASSARQESMHRVLLDASELWRSLPRRDLASLRFLLAGNPAIGPAIQLRLARDSNWSVRRKLALHPHLSSAAMKLLAMGHDMLIDNGLARNPAHQSEEILRFLESIGVHEVIPVSLVSCQDASGCGLPCQGGMGCLQRRLLPDAREQSVLQAPLPEGTGQQLFSEPYIIAPVSISQQFLCPESGCLRRFQYQRAPTVAAQFSDEGARISYCPHIINDH